MSFPKIGTDTRRNSIYDENSDRDHKVQACVGGGHNQSGEGQSRSNTEAFRKKNLKSVDKGRIGKEKETLREKKGRSVRSETGRSPVSCGVGTTFAESPGRDGTNILQEMTRTFILLGKKKKKNHEYEKEKSLIRNSGDRRASKAGGTP